MSCGMAYTPETVSRAPRLPKRDCAPGFSYQQMNASGQFRENKVRPATKTGRNGMIPRMDGVTASVVRAPASYTHTYSYTFAYRTPYIAPRRQPAAQRHPHKRSAFPAISHSP
jgi:hypothetical protein